MKPRTLLLLLILTGALTLHAQTLYAPLEQFAKACVAEKQALRVEQPDYDEQFEQLYVCLKTFTRLPLRDGQLLLHPSSACRDSLKSGHILFSPSYVTNYLNGKIPNPYSHSFPYVNNPMVIRSSTGHVVLEGEVDTVSVYYVNAVTCPDADAQFEYSVSAGCQQLILLSEDDTPLEVTVSSDAGTAVLRTNEPRGYAQYLWTEQTSSTVRVHVKNPSDRPVSFVIAVH